MSLANKYVGEKYESKNGKYEIIEYVGGNRQKVKVRFDLTGTEVICTYYAAKEGLVLDPEYITAKYVNQIYDSKFGKVKILEDVGWDKKLKCNFVKIKFLESGFIDIKRLNNVIEGKVKDPTYFMHTVKDKIFHSNNYGDYKIIADVGTDKNNAKIVRVKFIETGYEYDTRYDAARDGKVKDPTYFMHTVKDKIFHSNNYGDFIITNLVGHTSDGKHKIVTIKFIKTGTVKDVYYDTAIVGEVKDDYYSSKYIATKEAEQNMVNSERILHKLWKNMMNRCYNESSSSYITYGAKGVTVDPEWHNYENFRRDIMQLPGWQLKIAYPTQYQLDKDLFQYNLLHNERVYSKHTCVWMSYDINIKLAMHPYCVQIHYGCIYQIFNLFYVKTLPNDMPNYGPFDSLEAAVNMVNYVYNSIGMYNMIIPNFNYMTMQQIMQHTKDRKHMVSIISK